MKLLYILILNILSLSLYAQVTEKDSLSNQRFLTLVNANREQSYTTFGSGVGDLEPLLFEARLSPSFYFTGLERKWALTLNPQVQMRMLNKNSFPIRNPSYRISINYYHGLELWKHIFLRKILYKNALWFASLLHHSNGQEGSFYISDSTHEVNLQNGNFATNYLEIGLSSYKTEVLNKKYYSIREFKTYVEYHPPKWSIRELDGRYGYLRIFAKLGIIGSFKQGRHDKMNRFLQKSSLELKGGWIFGGLNKNSEADIKARLIVDVMYKYYPSWLDEIAFFLRFYRGQDYYNIYFVKHELTVVTFGITSNIMNFKKAVKVLN